jgi:hypothetical protein
MVFLILILLSISPAFGQSDDEPIDESLIDKNRAISRVIDDWANSLDVYLADQAYAEEPNRTTISLRNSFNWSEGGAFSYRPHIRVKLHLPNLQKKLQLRFTSYDEDLEERGINRNRFRQTPLEENYGTSIALFQKLGTVTTEFRPRVEITDQLETSYIVRFTSDAKVSFFKVEPEVQLFARSDSGTGQFAGLNFGFELSTANYLRLINEEQYTDGDNTYSTNNGFRFSHLYNDKMEQEYSMIFECNNREVYHLERYIFDTSFNHKLYRNVLHYSINPYVAFEKEHHFFRRFGTKVTIDFIF